MGTGDVMITQMTGCDSTFPFFLFSHQHSENHDQCGHAEAYSTVMLWGNSQESNMPSSRETLTHPQLPPWQQYFFPKHLNPHSFGCLFTLIIHVSFVQALQPYSKTTCRNCLWASCSFCCFPALSVVLGDCLDFADKGTGIRLVGEATLVFCKGIQTKNKTKNITKERKTHTPYRKHEKSRH